MARIRITAWVAASLAFLLVVIGSASAIEGKYLDSREGDNSIYFEWDRKEGRVATATSSTRITGESRVRITTSLRDRPGRIAMRASLKNVSEDKVIAVEGRIIHKVWDEAGDLVRRMKSRLFTQRLKPGEYVTARFSYRLPSGWYSARSDYKPR